MKRVYGAVLVTPIHVRVTADQKRELVHAAQAKGVDLSTFIRDAIDEYAERILFGRSAA